ncbi:replication endonuclease [Budvicia aquatica]|uniref:Replication endonuclease n=1 Tax=Budvicia aquatica TaxID=82979 RepID=A0A2C6CRC2_9GAMM|nr:replication endonuclease [Budvicia aquatica]
MPPGHQWAYPWNAPLPPISRPDISTFDIEEKEKFIGRLLAARSRVAAFPKFIQAPINKRIDDIERSQGIKKANAHLLNHVILRTAPRLELIAEKYKINRDSFVTAELRRDFNNLPDMDSKRRDELAFRIAAYLNMEMSLIADETAGEPPHRVAFETYSRIANIARAFNQVPPGFSSWEKGSLEPDAAISALFRLTSENWWRRRLKRFADLWREHLQIGLGNVSKKTSAYCSRTTQFEWKEQRRRTREFLESMQLEDEEGNRISLIEKYDGSNANPEIRRCEMMTRIRGFENVSLELGYVADFYTLTAPSKYHATTSAGYKNRKWQGSNPADTQRYLCGVWAKIRAKLARDGLPIFGIRVAEPHHDGTPHWHMLIFMRPSDVDAIRLVMRGHAMSEDFEELRSDKAKKARFYVEPIDPDKGSATGYVAKYISKNIDGYALDGEIDADTKEPLKEAALAASAWASRWRIRQFQFIGGAPVSVYRELRRMADTDTAKALDLDFAAVHDAADKGAWGEYVKAQGGPFVKRRELIVSLVYELKEGASEYGEDVKKIFGVQCSHVPGSPIRTRIKEWKIVSKISDEAKATSVLALAFELDLNGAFAPSRSSVNNCTEPQRRVSRNIELQLKSRGETGDPEQVSILIRGGILKTDPGKGLRIANNQLIDVRIGLDVGRVYRASNERDVEKAFNDLGI